VSESAGRFRIVLSRAARRDIVEVLKWSAEHFGERAAGRYQALLKQALRDIAADPECPGSQARPELATGVRAYHLRHSRDRVRSTLGIVRQPRHFVIYRRRDRILDIVRVLHDVRDLALHLR
jgi:toxin ParE1/3/4